MRLVNTRQPSDRVTFAQAIQVGLAKAGGLYTPEPIPAGMMGVGGTTTWRFRALKLGTQTLEFAYLPSWDISILLTWTPGRICDAGAAESRG